MAIGTLDTDFEGRAWAVTEGLPEGVLSEALTARRRYIDSLVIGRWGRAAQHYEARVAAAHDVPLGEVALPMLLRVLGAPKDLAEHYAVPWLCLYHHALIADDIADGDLPTTFRGIEKRLLSMAVRRWKAAVGDSSSVWDRFALYQCEQRRARMEAPKEDRHIGQRAALVKFLASAIMWRESGRVLVPREVSGIEALCEGLQILDDLSDVSIDSEMGRPSYVLANGEGSERVRGLSPIHVSNLVRRAGLRLQEAASLLEGEALVEWIVPVAIRLDAAAGRLTLVSARRALQNLTALEYEGNVHIPRASN